MNILYNKYFHLSSFTKTDTFLTHFFLFLLFLNIFLAQDFLSTIAENTQYALENGQQ